MIPFQFRTLGCAGPAAWHHISIPMQLVPSTSFTLYIYLITLGGRWGGVGSSSQEPLNPPIYTYFSRASAETNLHIHIV